ncbi:uncharacterized protein PFLUO_LOCUS7497 [Penicillium psychrofluorescens]|uniref:uncharacterized protein n=1 Tax=Penicillium psychrofluorescens TaxID=3158075 RepID=UPI003CCDD697
MPDPKHPPTSSSPTSSNHAGNVSLPAGKSDRAQLLAALAATDVTIRRIDQLLSTADGQETVLATINYVSSILHHLSASAPWIALQTRLSLLTRLSGRQLPLPQPSKSAPSKSKLAALSSVASETRYNLRLFGLLPLWIWGSDILKSPPADPILHALAHLQVVSNVIYQLLENVAYLAEKGVVSRRWVDKYGGVDKWYIWSTRGWFGHIFFQFFVLWRKSVLRRRRVAAQRAAAPATAGSEKNAKAEDDESLRLEVRAWRKSLVNNAIWAPLCIHWCLEKGIGIPEHLIGLLSFFAGVWGLRDAWAATAKA